MLTTISSKSIHNVFLFTFLCLGTYQAYTDEQPNKNLDKYLAKLDKMLEKIPEEDAYQVSILHAKRQILNDFAKLCNKDKKPDPGNNNKKQDPEAHFYQPKQPKPLTEEEKKEDVKQRIAKKYFGELPKKIDSIIYYMANHKKCLEKIGTLSNRALLHGEPGTGKTLLVKVLSEELEIPMLSFSATLFQDKYIGESSRRIRRAFETAIKFDKPIFLFIDEIDALASKRKENMHNEYRAILTTLLTELEDLKENKNIFIFFATNDLDSLDAAILDRFSGSVIAIEYLNKEQRAQFFKKLYADEGEKISDEFAQRLAEVTENRYIKRTKTYKRFSNRDIKEIVSSSLFQRNIALDQDPNAHTHLCKYVREAMDIGDFEGKFAYWTSSKYCDGI